MKLSIIAGARPNFMKIAPLMRTILAGKQLGMDMVARLIYTGCKSDSSLESTLFRDLDMPEPDVYLGAESTEFFHRFADIVVKFSEELDAHPADVVLVVDDLTPTMACSFVARKKGIRVAHLVAGTHCFDLNKPKELNRVITDALSDILFTAGMSANRNLNQTGKQQQNVYYVGNILIDSLRHNLQRWVKPDFLSIIPSAEQGYVLLTLNKHVLVDNKPKLESLLDVMTDKISMPILAPVHDYVSEKLSELCSHKKHLFVLPTQSYLAFSYLVGNAKLIITDSGNIAEEATFLGIPCITLNDVAEHPETVIQGTNVLVGENVQLLREAIETWLAGEWKKGSIPERWDGHTAERIVQTLLSL